MPVGVGRIDTSMRDGRLVVIATGAWTIRTAPSLSEEIDRMGASNASSGILDLSGVEELDTAGALLVRHLHDRIAKTGMPVEMAGTHKEHATLIDRVVTAGGVKPLPTEVYNPLIALVERVGRAACDACTEAADLLYFLGVTTVSTFRSLVRPKRIRIIPVLSHIEHVGLDALPIVGLLSFLIGVVLAYQGADQLRQFGAEIFTVDLLGISIFREMGVLLTAIVIAGRSGSAFAAQIGTMQVNQEIDAMQTLGLDPVDMLVLPRIFALLISMPLLAVFADVMGLMGGGLMVILTLDVSLVQFLERLQNSISVSTYWVGIVKAPVFGFLIALTGCREGLKVTGSAESVGHHTTRAVVISIFLVIVADAFFSILFSRIGF
ncbi:MAG: MlaE family lipid ABC transporter permease subunit [Rhodospirillaceae bacterium]|jgi:phospholipid/cholesterol/gamma-HCH transport system permease protein|nr:MlaE family lipid ABC transporter permease subunit [Rhodospirillaceae bacterium]MBT5456903.1 MlaE family lipid ABC transporter permease subunit [Rhodospirillaceae bacterium]